MVRLLVFGMNPGMGGVQMYLMNLYRNIDHSKIQMDFVVPGDRCHYADEIKQLGGEIFYIRPKRKSLLGNVTDLIRLFKICKGTHRIIYFNLSVLYYNIPFILAKAFGFPFIISHGHSARDPSKRKNLRYYLHCMNRVYVSRSSSRLFACSNKAAEWVFGKRALKNGQVTIIPNAINVEKFLFKKEIRHKKRSELGIENDVFVVGHIGRFSNEKNHLFLLDIFKEITRLKNNAILILVGDGELRPKIEEKVTMLHLADNVKLLGERTDIPDLLHVFDAFVLPSLFEGFSIVLIEAQTCGLPCFASKHAVPDQVDITGLVKFISLETPAQYWAYDLVQYSNAITRIGVEEMVKQSGFEITEMAVKFEEYVLDISGE